MGRLTGKVALITGAARGQGAAAARKFVAEGADVMIADILDEVGAELAEEISAQRGPDSGRVAYQHLDVTSEEDWTAAVQRTVTDFGSLSVLVNNAGILAFKALQDTTLAEYERVIRINQIGTFLGMRSVVEPMTASGGGSIVNLSSIEGLAAAPMVMAYTASKFAIRGMTKVAAFELGPRGIRVNSVHPGMIDTKMVFDALGGLEMPTDWVKSKLALGRVGKPEEVANLVLFLASDESSYSTGAEFVVDGGATATHALKV